MNIPQAVTNRYVSNLLTHGQNNEFMIDSVTRHVSLVEGTPIGYYYKVGIVLVLDQAQQWTSVGPTILGALHNALLTSGVTFR